MNPTFIGKAKITKTGQVTVPTEARSAVGLDTNEGVYWYELSGILIASTKLMSEEDVLSQINKSKSQSEKNKNKPSSKDNSKKR